MLPERFTSKFFIEPNSGCWLWTASADRNGYGLIVNWNAPKKVYAHRYSWELHYGPVPNGIFVLHKCDTPACCNPAHLFLGTQSDNVKDKVRKGRQSKTPGQRGDLCRTAKLSWTQVRDIRTSTESGRALARKHDVSRKTITLILRGETWKEARAA